MATDQTITITDVTTTKLDVLRRWFEEQDGEVSGDETSGTAVNDCFAATFTHEPSTGLLTLDLTNLMPNVTARGLRSQILGVIDPPPQVLTSDGGTVYKPTPTSCATYNWAIGFFTNETSSELTFSSQSTQHGNIDGNPYSIPAAATPGDNDDGWWKNKGTKDAATGCYGSLIYTFADGITTMTVNYGVNTESTTSATVGLAGQNASSYSVTMDKKTGFHSAAAYLYPYVTISNAN